MDAFRRSKELQGGISVTIAQGPLPAEFLGRILHGNGYLSVQAQEGSDEYGGPKPFSEPETRIVKLIGEAVRPQAFVNLHSGEYAIYVPWDSKRSLAPNLPADINDILERLDSYCQCMHGPAGEVAG
jgi:hypothetical protein